MHTATLLGCSGIVGCAVYPPFFIGPFAPGHVIPPGVIDHCHATQHPHSDILGHHHVLIGSPEWFDLRNAVDHLRDWSSLASPLLRGGRLWRKGLVVF
ncbi:hypothetical protein BDM02DRAFT_3106993 [Thelephora ganbajun]|uniref:Uncharacterized protein n=1 Tax=Thelephora ganbajun TaxID=370292 RepID=A0ACB6ZWJ7_THEGA|nr:hypothetical protein BDM02DRAFT_3106993 [Thelephora ganbajun]